MLADGAKWVLEQDDFLVPFSMLSLNQAQTYRLSENLPKQ